MALSSDEQDVFKRCYAELRKSKRELELRDAYYDGVQRVENMGIAIPPELEDFLTVVNWPRIAVDSVEERLDLTGFRTGAEKKASTAKPSDPDDKETTDTDDAEDEKAAELWRIWQANDLDSEAPLAHLESLILRHSFIIVGADEDDEDTPLITVESPYDVMVLDDPRRPRSPEAAMKLWRSDERKHTPNMATLYTREATIENELIDGKWREVDRVEHDFKLVPVTRMSNSGRLRKRGGRSEIDDIMTLTDAAARSLTNLQVASESHGVPSRVITGASRADFIDAKTGKHLPTWEAYFGALNALENSEARIAQFSASDLTNFHNTVLHYARLVSALTGLPPHYLGFGAEQPPSAEAIKSVEARLVKRCERRQVAFGYAWERSMSIVQLMIGQTKVDDPGRGLLEVLWRDAGTPTQAQVDDGAVKKKQAGILSTEGAMEMTGMSQVAIRRELRRLKAEQAQLAELDPITGLADRMRAGQSGQPGGTPGSNPATAPAAQGRTSTTSATRTTPRTPAARS